MKRWQDALVQRGSTIRRTIQTIDNNAMQIALVVDAEGKLLGTVTDGDIRRGILKGVSLDDTVETVMNPSPAYVTPDRRREHIFSTMKQKQLRHLPVVDSNGRVIGLQLLDDMLQSSTRPNIVVLMAGGLGSRLRPLTDQIPKPMLKIGSKPILETILENFIECGFRCFYLAVNYKAEVVQDYFENGERWGVEIKYIHEPKRLGTAGALSLLPEKPKDPVIVMNGDLLTKVNFQHLLDFHAAQGAEGTMCVREYDFQVPYGVVTTESQRIVGIDEKPIQRFFVNAGIYVLDPAALDVIPQDQFFDMPTLFQGLGEQNRKTVAFPVREYWIDIGKIDDFHRANGEFFKIFTD